MEPGYSPPEQTESLSVIGSRVAALAMVDEQGSAASLACHREQSISAATSWAMIDSSIYRAGSRNISPAGRERFQRYGTVNHAVPFKRQDPVRPDMTER
jgi:hypothetical protein